MRILITTFLLVELLTLSSPSPIRDLKLYESFREFFDSVSNFLVSPSTYVTSNEFIPLVSESSFSDVLLPSAYDRSFTTTDCISDGCYTDITERFDLNMQAGSLYSFAVQYSNQTVARNLRVYVDRFDIINDLDYVYSQPQWNIYSYFSNSDDSEYELCQSQCDPSFINPVGETATCDYVHDPRTVSAKTTLSALGDKLACGHWTATSLGLCQRKTLLTNAREFLSFYVVSETYYVNASVCIGLEGQTPTCVEFYSQFDGFPLTLKSSDDVYSLTFRTLYDVPRPYVGSSIASYSTPQVDYLDTEHDVVIKQWYYLNTIPSFGSLPASGIGSVQTRYIDTASNRSSGVYSSSSLRGLVPEWNTFSCAEDTSTSTTRAFPTKLVVITTSTAAALRSVSNTLHRRSRGLYVKSRPQKQPKVVCTVIVVVVVAAIVAGAVVGGLAITADNNTCCVSISGEKYDVISDLTNYMETVESRLGSETPTLPSTVSYVLGFPQVPKLKLSSTTGAKMSVDIQASGVFLDYASGSGLISDWSVDYVKWFYYSGGSYITLSFQVTGDYLSVNLVSDDVVFAVSTFTIEYGSSTKQIAISVINTISPEFRVCVNGRSDCKTPTEIDRDDGAVGGEVNSGAETDLGTAASTHWSFLWSNWSFGLSWIIWVIFISIALVFIIFLLLFKVFPKLVKFLTYYLCCCCLLKSADGAITILVTDYDPPTAIQAAMLRHTDGLCNVTTFDPMWSYDSYWIQSITTRPYTWGINMAFEDFTDSNGDIFTLPEKLFYVSSGYPNAAAPITTNSNMSQTSYDMTVTSDSNALYQHLEEVSIDSSCKYHYFYIGGVSEKTYIMSACARTATVICEFAVGIDSLDYLLYLVSSKNVAITLNGGRYQLSLTSIIYYGVFDQSEINSALYDHYGSLYSEDNLLFPRDITSNSAAFTTDALLHLCPTCSPDGQISISAVEDFLNTGYRLFIRNKYQHIDVVPTSYKSASTVTATCWYSNIITYCNGTNFDIVSLLRPNASIVQSYLQVGSISVPFFNYKFEMLFEVSPTCTGELAFDSLGNLVCTQDCCVYTDDDLRTVHYLSGGDIATPTFTTSSRRVSYYTSENTFTSRVSTTNSCNTGSYANAWNCYIETYPSVFWTMASFTALILLTIVLYLCYKLFCLISQRIKFRKRTVSNKKSNAQPRYKTYSKNK